jgi:hypothetical protein
LGVLVNEGHIQFAPVLLSKDELLTGSVKWSVGKEIIELQKGELGFTYCGVPIIYSIAEAGKIEVEMADGATKLVEGNMLDKNISQQIFNRNKEINRITVFLPAQN